MENVKKLKPNLNGRMIEDSFLRRFFNPITQVVDGYSESSKKFVNKVYKFSKKLEEIVIHKNIDNLNFLSNEIVYKHKNMQEKAENFLRKF